MCQIRQASSTFIVCGERNYSHMQIVSGWVSVPMAAGWLSAVRTEYTSQLTDQCLFTHSDWLCACVFMQHFGKPSILSVMRRTMMGFNTGNWRLTFSGNINLWEPTLGTFLFTCGTLTSRKLNNKYISTWFWTLIFLFTIKKPYWKQLKMWKI